MKDIIWPGFLNTFLKVIESSPLEKKILDCGAGGTNPPLAFFRQRGFETYGIDISEKAIKLATSFAKQNQLELNIRLGDMKKLPFDDDFFSFVYTQNSICHLSKKETKIAIDEIKRVLKRNGYCLVDFMSVECSFCNEEEMGRLVGDHEYHIKERDEDFFHSFFRDPEIEAYFFDMTIRQIDKVISEFRAVRKPYTDVRIYVYAQKPE